MALLQTSHSTDYLIGGRQSPARLAAQSFADLAENLSALLRTALLRQWSMQQQGLRRWRITTERARQRRALAQLSDRELRDIGITRYEVDFVLRQGFRR